MAVRTKTQITHRQIDTCEPQQILLCVLSSKIIAKVQERFANRSFHTGLPPKPVVVFIAAHADVGAVQIFDDGSELTLVAGKFTHGHFSDFDPVSDDAAEDKIVTKTIEFLEQLFADEIVMWGSHQSGGGWQSRKLLAQDAELDHLYVWSGPLKRT